MIENTQSRREQFLPERIKFAGLVFELTLGNKSYLTPRMELLSSCCGGKIVLGVSSTMTSQRVCRQCRSEIIFLNFDSDSILYFTSDQEFADKAPVLIDSWLSSEEEILEHWLLVHQTVNFVETWFETQLGHELSQLRSLVIKNLESQVKFG
jgi:hypothetical protein